MEKNKNKATIDLDELKSKKKNNKVTVDLDDIYNSKSSNKATVDLDELKTKKKNNKATVDLDDIQNSNNKATVDLDSINNRSTLDLNEIDDENYDEILENGQEIDGGYVIESILSNDSGQSIVYTANKDGKKYVVKLYRSKATVIDKDVIEALTNNINSEYVIPLVHSGNYNGNFFTVTPYYEEGTVIDHLEEIDDKLLKNNYINQLNEGLNAIHKAGILHCDIKPHNIYFTNNRKALVIADFGISLPIKNYDIVKGTNEKIIPKRELQKNNVTLAYLAPEGDEYASESVDYFALGMSILNMAHKGDVYEDVADENIRDRIMVTGVRIPDNVDPEIGMLISKLVETDSKRRIGYNEVKKWCKDPSCYGKYYSKENSICDIIIENAAVRGIIYNSTEDYTEGLINKWDIALEHYESYGIINDIGRTENIERTKIEEFSDIQTYYKKLNKNDNGLLLTLLKLNPSLTFKFKDKDFNDFKGYIKYLDNELLENKDVFFDQKIILQELFNENKINQLPNYSKILNIVNMIFDSTYSDNYKAELMRNYFTIEDNIILNNTKYDTIDELANLMFDENMDPIENELIFNDLFLDLLLNRFPLVKEKEKKIKQIYSLKDKFNRNAQFSIFLTNVIRYNYEGEELYSLFDFFSYGKKIYENKLNPSHLAYLLREGKVYKFYDQFDSKEADKLTFLKKLKSSKLSDTDLVAYFYNETQEDTVFVYKNKMIGDIPQLIQIISSSNDIDTISTELVNFDQFKMWLSGNGYTDALAILKDKN